MAFLFTLSNKTGLSLDNFKGGIGFQIYFTKDLAFRTGLGLVNYSNIEEDPSLNDIDKSTKTFEFKFSPAIRHNLYKTNSIITYWGPALSIAYNQNIIANQNFRASDPEITNTKTIYGLATFFGVEYFPIKEIAIALEYKFEYTSSSGTKKIKFYSGETEQDLPNESEINFGTKNIQINISIFIN
jgi:hypothetical protein